MNVDMAVITETITRQGMAAFIDIPNMWAQVEAYMMPTDGVSQPDYYQAGIIFGQIVKLLFDLNINN